MNDEHSNQLTQKWPIPTYAQNSLWVSSAFETVQASGEHGLFSLSQPTDTVIVRWGDPEGIGLVQLRWRADALDWTGEVRVGGSVEAMHYIGADDEETTIAVVVFSGQVLLPGVRPFPRLGLGGRAEPRTDFLDGLERTEAITLSTWVLAYSSPLFALCQEALASKLNAYLWGRLTDKGDGRKGVSPLLLHEITLFAT